MIALAGALAVTAPRRADAAGQPIDWLMRSTLDEDVDLVEIIRASAAGDAAAGSESWRREAAEKRRETAKEKTTTTTTTTDEEREPADVGKTATKFGKLGVILVLADVVTAAVMGKSVLGVAKSLEREMELDENGAVVEVKKVESGDWKDGSRISSWIGSRKINASPKRARRNLKIDASTAHPSSSRVIFIESASLIS